MCNNCQKNPLLKTKSGKENLALLTKAFAIALPCLKIKKIKNKKKTLTKVNKKQSAFN